MASSNLDLFQLVKKLKYEKLFIANERREIEALNRRVQILCTDLLQQSWLTGQHRLALENLARGQVTCPFSNEYVTTPSDGSRDSTEHIELELVDAQKLISPKYYQSYIDLVTLLRLHPDIVGLCITTFEKERHHLIPIVTGQANISSGQILQAIINIYGGVGGPLPGDGTLHLKLLSVLAGHQIVGADSPRRVLRQGSSAFSTLYRLISETIPSSRLFLIGALHQPVTQLLSSPELLCLGTNISPTTPLSMEVTASFCSASTNKDIASLDRTEKMAQLTKLFIESILDHVHAFPTGLAWLIKSVHAQLSQTNPEKEVNSICTDLIWALFICPAVTNPEPFGVTDASVGTQARHTLSQVATILQALALHPWEGNDPRLTEYISFFETTCLSSVLEQVLNMDGLPTEQLSAVTSLFRRTVLLPENQLQPLFAWLKECLLLLERNGKLTDIEIWPSLVKLSSAVNDSITTLSPSATGSNSPSHSGHRTPPIPSLVGSGSNPNLAGSPSHRPSSLLSNGKAALLGRRGDSKNPSTPGSTGDLQAENPKPVPVVIIPITQQGWEWVGMLPESEVASSASKNGKLPKSTSESTGDADSLLCGMDEAEDDEREDRNVLGEKRTRFSISQDDASIGTSDNLEAVSEAASTHSVSSSIELEDQNDNFSDMMSANVSGRGTPNVSGRNTPLSQAEEPEEENLNDEDMENDEDVPMNDEEDLNPPQPVPMNLRPPNINNLNLNGPMPNPSKQARSEIEDKFCKFEIKKMFGGDETVSLVSDTWSTDVLASDSEMGGEGRLLLPTDGANIHRSHSSRVSVDASGGGESMSEAWSTDVAANDIERLHDFDTEETSSVARSDDTGVTFDTPRSSVSGVVQYRGADLLLFDDMQAIGDRNASGNAPDSTSENGPMEMDVERTDAYRGGPAIAQGILIPEIISSDANTSSTIVTVNGPGPSSRTLGGPKTITFDKTAERGDRKHGDDEPGRTKKFFGNFKIFRGRARKSRGMDDRYDWDRERLPDNPSIPVPKMRKSFSEDVGAGPSGSALPAQGVTESSDEILAKYRRKPSLNDPNFSPIFTRDSNKSSTGSCNGSVGPSSSQIVRKESLKVTRTELAAEARKKLRSVLSNCDLQLFQSGTYGNPSSMDIALINMLRIEVANAVSRADQVTAAQLQEAIRTVQQLGVDGCRKVIRHLRDDYRRRSDYVSYLIRAKQGLLSTIHFLEKATERAKHEGETYSHYLVTEWIRLRLEEPAQENAVLQFSADFRSRRVFDEKIELLERFIASLVEFFASNKELNFWQIAQVENALEQHIVSKIYLHALHPNGEVDVHRDLVLKEHIIRLEAIITPSHKDLRIPKSHLGECPWPPAQRELKMLSAYKTASDKLKCVVRASSLIVSLLSSSAEKAIAADDFVPVLVFVIIKSNPPALLSTIQYVNSFYGQKIVGEDQYWWTQFCSAVEFIKTMDYND